MTLSEIKNKTEELALDDLSEALDYLRAQLPDDSPAEGTVLGMIRRLNRARANFRKGLVPMGDLDIIENQIFEALLAFLRELDEAKLQNGGRAGTGKILYEIPHRMTVEEEVRCRVRLAFLERVLLDKLELEEYSEVHDIPVGEVMSVELVDPAAEPVFAIRTISDEVQRVDPDFFSEWWFYVKPLAPGKFPLVLRVSIVERVDGADRKRNIVLEEVVDIVETPAEPETVEFRESSIVLRGAAPMPAVVDEPGDAGDTEWSNVPRRIVEEKPGIPPVPQPAPAPETATPSREASKASRRPFPTWLPLLVIAVVGATFVLTREMGVNPIDFGDVSEEQWEEVQSRPTVGTVQNFLREHANEPEMEKAVELLLDMPPDRTGGMGKQEISSDSLHRFLERDVLPQIEDPDRREWLRKKIE